MTCRRIATLIEGAVIWNDLANESDAFTRMVKIERFSACPKTQPSDAFDAFGKVI
jgi:hypothetical protein